MSSEEELRSLVLDLRASPSRRIVAMAELSGQNPVAAAQALLIVGGRQDETPEILRAAGTSLARASDSGAAVSEFDMRDLTPAAYEAYCDCKP